MNGSLFQNVEPPSVRGAFDQPPAIDFPCDGDGVIASSPAQRPGYQRLTRITVTAGKFGLRRNTPMPSV
jgi:hypothetical protein